MDLVGAYSNPSDQLERLRTLLALPQAAQSIGQDRPSKQYQKRLTPDEIAQLVAACEAGGRTKELAAQLGIHRTTVTKILQREGVTLRPPGIHPDELPEAIRLYKHG